MDILHITEKTQIDESIEEYEFNSYEPISGTNLNNPGEIRINIETQELFTHAVWSVIHCFDPSFRCCFHKISDFLSVWASDHWQCCSSQPEITFALAVPYQNHFCKISYAIYFVTKSSLKKNFNTKWSISFFSDGTTFQ